MFVVAPPLSVDRVMAALEGLEKVWDHIGACLRIPEATRRNIAEEHSEDVGRLRATVVQWLLSDPVASWRRLIWRLHEFGVREDVRQAAANIIKYAEELPG